MNRRTAVLVVAVLVAVGIAGFLMRQRERHSQGDVRLGVILSLTGDVGAYGQRSLKGLNVALAEINGSGGVNGRQVALEVEDAKSSPRDAVSALTKLIDLDHLRVIIGDVLSGTTLAMAPIAQRKGVVLFAPGASNPAMRNAGDFIFRNWVSDDYDGKAIAHYMFHDGVTNTCVLNQQTDYAVGLADAFEKEFGAIGGHIDGRDSFVTESTDFRTQLVKLQREDCTAVYLVGESRQNGTILRQAREIGIQKRWFANLTVDTPECQAIAGPARDGVVFTTPAFDPNDTAPQVRRFVDAYRRQYHEEPDVTSGIAYDALMILASVIKAVGDDPGKIRDQLHQLRGFPGVSGSTSFDAHGDVVKNIFIKVIRNGQPALVQEFAL